MTTEQVQQLERDVQRILEWPRGTWSEQETRQVAQLRAHLHSEMFSLADQAEREKRNLTAAEQDAFDGMQAEFDRLGGAVSPQR